MICTLHEILGDKVKRWARHVANVGREEMHSGFWVEKPEGKGRFGRPVNIWKDNIKIDFL